MATLIICPVCDTRYETAAVFPPEGRKVRCSKCSHVWQAVAVTLQPAAAGAPAASSAKPAATPQQKPATAAPVAPNVAAQPRSQPAPRPAAQSPGFTGLQTPKPQPSAMPKPPPPPPPPPQAPRGDADFDTGGDMVVEATSYNAEAWVGGEDSPAEKSKSGGLFGRFTAKKAATPAPAAPSAPQPGTFEAALAEAYKTDKGGTGDAGLDAEGDASLGVPDLDAPPPPPRKKAKSRFSPVTIGWAALAAIVALVLGTLLFAPSTVVSIVPGAARLYSLLGMPVGTHGLAFQGVRYGWTNEGGQMVLEVQGDVVNNSGSKVEVPTVVIALRDESGEEISEWTTEVSETELEGGETTAFLRQIPSPPSNVRSVKVRFAKAAE
ncbi:zinc-ribbon domain-containing protein [Methyloceanibacter sp.]|uniref:zinc-ribbon domain-containing protein n=1 Tax=Methyloceanibacter sp. TaxID=1965321 RepID=UPI00351B6B40